ncbi:MULTISPECIES: hypothetical protein [unclassified Sutcliffiella]|uniref:hypothetical protein n=1 Tax=unclassified Sutcliffiella TaxID=2837532 RepID=UPI0030CFC6CD
MNRYYNNSNWRITGVVASATGDVNGDLIPDSVYVTGYRESEVSIIQNMVLGIRDGATGVSVSIPLKENMGMIRCCFWRILRETGSMIF